jgi:hypothetical protein
MGNVVGGDGVGVFVEYQAGGYWHVRWTCDSTHSRDVCKYHLQASAKSLSDVTGEGLPMGALVVQPTQVNVDTLTTYETHGITLKTDPGEALTVSVGIEGIQGSAYWFFVQGGKVNGGYDKGFTSPMQFVGSTP